MPGPSIPKPLTGLLGRLGLGAPSPRTGEGGEKTTAGLKATPEGAEPGAELGSDGELLSGMGYTLSDRRTQHRNRLERANIDRFLSEMDPGLESEPPRPQKGEAAGAEAKEADVEAKALPGEAEVAEGEAADGAEGEVAAEEHGEEVRGFAAEHELEGPVKAESELEAREDAESEGGGGSGDEAEEDEEDRPGGGWVAEEQEEREKRRRRDAGSDALGATTRCRGHIHDGSRCLRKPVDGTPYCREHRLT